MTQKTLILLKPDAVERGLCGEILHRFERAGLKIMGMKMVWIDKVFAAKHYDAHVKKDFYKSLEEYITSGPVLAIVLEGVSAVTIVRKMGGDTEPKKSLPGTIRGDFAVHSYDYADNKGISIKNLIHASGTAKEAEAEIKMWFSDEELHSYEAVHEKHTR
ncbi:nucleoside-diphosphate kinase [Candidatus Woesearchaeota archaeon]|jgi:nucleoside-diphosphate kinase|nr:nucleoside-diphosphate kinase [Candidatus Woesearchaeota archaeon]